MSTLKCEGAGCPGCFDRIADLESTVKAQAATIDDLQRVIRDSVGPSSATQQTVAALAETTAERNELRRLLDESEAREVEARRDFSDKPLPEDDAIREAHPLRSGRHSLYMEAARLVGARQSKGALIELVNWLMARVERADIHVKDAESDCARYCRQVIAEMERREIVEQNFDALRAKLEAAHAALAKLQTEHDAGTSFKKALADTGFPDTSRFQFTDTCLEAGIAWVKARAAVNAKL